MTGPRLGLIGAGRGGRRHPAALAEQGVTVAGDDARADAPAVQAVAARAGVSLAGSVAELVAAVDVVLCLTKAASRWRSRKRPRRRSCRPGTCTRT